MKSLWITLLFLAVAAFAASAELPRPVTSLNGTDDVQLLIKGYPEEKYDISSTLCGIKPTPEFQEGFLMARRLCLLGATPHYLVYSEYGEIPKSYLPLKTLTLTNYKHTAKLLEAIRGFNFSMAMKAFEAKHKERTKEGEQDIAPNDR
jgi:hypothetical protein